MNTKGIVLLYHRVIDIYNDPWRLSVNPSVFNSHISMLQREFSIESLSSIGRSNRINDKPTVFITFDDGYLDNLTMAKPILDKYNAAATYFVTTSAIEEKREFWWDALENIVFNSDSKTLKDILYFAKNKKYYGESRFIQFRNEIARLFDNGNYRKNIYFRLWQVLYFRKSIEKESLLDNMFDIARMSRDQRESHRTLTSSCLSKLCDSDIQNIGGHGETHDALAEFDTNYANDDVRKNLNYLKRYSNNVNTFSYPHGSVSQGIEDVFYDMGVKCAFITQSGFLDPDHLSFNIPRLTVVNWSAEILLEKIKIIIDSE